MPAFGGAVFTSNGLSFTCLQVIMRFRGVLGQCDLSYMSTSPGGISRDSVSLELPARVGLKIINIAVTMTPIQESNRNRLYNVIANCLIYASFIQSLAFITS